MSEEKNGKFEITIKAVVLNESNQVLILKRSKKDLTGPGKFDLPGGAIGTGEKIENGLKREILEEIGININIGPVLYIFDWEKDIKVDGKKIDLKGIRMLAYYKSGEVKLGEEHEEYEWINLDEAIKKFEDEGFERDKKEAIIKAKEYLELKDYLNNWKRCQADFENYKKDQEKMLGEFRKFASLDMVMQILPVLDNFNVSLEHVPEDQKDSAWVTGIVYIKKQLEDVLKNNGAEEIEVKIGDNFNPELHEAIKQEVGSEKLEVGKLGNKIKKVAQKGYKIDGEVIRAARVIVN